jgi:archaellum component FlaC
MSVIRLSQNWVLSEPSTLQAVAFDTPIQDEVGTLVWKLDLPKSPQASDRELGHLEQEIMASKQVLEKIPQEIELVGSRRIKGRATDLSFLNQVTTPEAELFEMLDDISPLESSFSFEISKKSRINWLKATQEFENSLNRIKSMISQFALVETSVEGQVIGRTIISWSGKTDSSLQATSGYDKFHLHQRSLQSALASRYLLINTMVVTAQSAARLSALLAIPGGAIVALPAVWKYINRIMNELEKYHNITM